MIDDKVIWCQVCNDYYSESRFDVYFHIQDEHSLRDRLRANVERGPEPDDTHA